MHRPCGRMPDSSAVDHKQRPLPGSPPLAKCMKIYTAQPGPHRSKDRVFITANAAIVLDGATASASVELDPSAYADVLGHHIVIKLCSGDRTDLAGSSAMPSMSSHAGSNCDPATLRRARWRPRHPHWPPPCLTGIVRVTARPKRCRHQRRPARSALTMAAIFRAAPALSGETSAGNGPRRATAIAGDGLPVSPSRDIPDGLPGQTGPAGHAP